MRWCSFVENSSKQFGIKDFFEWNEILKSLSNLLSAFDIKHSIDHCREAETLVE